MKFSHCSCIYLVYLLLLDSLLVFFLPPGTTHLRYLHFLFCWITMYRWTPPHLLDSDRYGRSWVNGGWYMQVATYELRAFLTGSFSLPTFFLRLLQTQKLTAHFESPCRSPSHIHTAYIKNIQRTKQVSLQVSFKFSGHSRMTDDTGTHVDHSMWVSWLLIKVSISIKNTWKQSKRSYIQNLLKEIFHCTHYSPSLCSDPSTWHCVAIPPLSDFFPFFFCRDIFAVCVTPRHTALLAKDKLQTGTK